MHLKTTMTECERVEAAVLLTQVQLRADRAEQQTPIRLSCPPSLLLLLHIFFPMGDMTKAAVGPAFTRQMNGHIFTLSKLV